MQHIFWHLHKKDKSSHDDEVDDVEVCTDAGKSVRSSFHRIILEQMPGEIVRRRTSAESHSLVLHGAGLSILGRHKNGTESAEKGHQDVAIQNSTGPFHGRESNVEKAKIRFYNLFSWYAHLQKYTFQTSSPKVYYI